MEFSSEPKNKRIFLSDCNKPRCTNTQPNTGYEDGLSRGCNKPAAVMKDSDTSGCNNILTERKTRKIYRIAERISPGLNGGSEAQVSNTRPAGHIRPAASLYVAPVSLKDT